MDDLDFIAGMMSDAEVMRHYPRPLDREGSRAWIQRALDRYARDGYGLWLVVEGSSGKPVGQVGIAVQEVAGAQEKEAGWLIHSPFWRRGYAVEAGRRVLRHAIEKLDAPHVISLIQRVNVASVGVARKLGMTVRNEADFHGRPHDVYWIRREEWEQLQRETAGAIDSE